MKRDGFVHHGINLAFAAVLPQCRPARLGMDADEHMPGNRDVTACEPYADAGASRR
jgi:hypothetical protein